jgi:hypothetical protein
MKTTWPAHVDETGSRMKPAYAKLAARIEATIEALTVKPFPVLVFVNPGDDVEALKAKAAAEHYAKRPQFAGRGIQWIEIVWLEPGEGAPAEVVARHEQNVTNYMKALAQHPEAAIRHEDAIAAIGDENLDRIVDSFHAVIGPEADALMRRYRGPEPQK